MRNLPPASVLVSAFATMSLGCGPRSGPVVVDLYVAASMARVMAEIEVDFEAAHPGTDLRVVSGGSQLLAAQIREGAPAELLVTADVASMQAVVQAGAIVEHGPLARNRVVVVARRDLPSPVTTIGDLARPGLRVVLAAPEVPIGRYARTILDEAGLTDGVTRNVVSLEADVLAVLSAVESGEADAALVYATDVAARVESGGSQISVIKIDDHLQPAVALQIGLVASDDEAASTLARELRAYLTTGPGRAKLLERGFEAP